MNPPQPLLRTLASRLISALRLLALCLPLSSAIAAVDSSTDPLNSLRWQDMKREFFGSAPVVFDSRVVVTAPATAEDSMNVPISVRVESGLAVDKIVIFAELNPIIRTLEFEPLNSAPYVSFRIKVQQSTPIRAAARDKQGTWHVGGTWVSAAGGGCTAPSTGRSNDDWQSHLGEVHGRLWPKAGTDGQDGQRLRVQVMHPMDTGLASGIPAFYVQKLAVTDDQGRELLRLNAFEPVSADPVFSFDLPATPGRKLRLTGVDNNGNRIDRELK